VALQDPELWRDNPNLLACKDEAIKELVLKNVQILEIEQILERNGL
jgi:hypothetical protein